MKGLFATDCVEKKRHHPGIDRLQHLILQIPIHTPLYTDASTAQFSDLRSFPAETGEIEHPALDLILEELNGQRLGPRFENRIRSRVIEHVIVRLEAHAVVRDVVPGVIHVDVQLGAGEELEAS